MYETTKVNQINSFIRKKKVKFNLIFIRTNVAYYPAAYVFTFPDVISLSTLITPGIIK